MLRKASEAVIDSMMAVIATHGPGLDQGRDRRGAAPRGGQSRAHLRVLPDRGRDQPQPRAVRPALGGGRRAARRLRRQLPGLHRRPRPHGDRSASRTRSWTTCWARSRRSSDRPFKPSAPAPSAAEIYENAARRWSRSRSAQQSRFFGAHGMGLVSHEAPAPDQPRSPGALPTRRETAARDRNGDLDRDHAEAPERGFIKLEDTVVVTDTGFEIFGEGGRGWNRGGTALRQ